MHWGASDAMYKCCVVCVPAVCTQKQNSNNGSIVFRTDGGGCWCCLVVGYGGGGIGEAVRHKSAKTQNTKHITRRHHAITIITTIPVTVTITWMGTAGYDLGTGGGGCTATITWMGTAGYYLGTVVFVMLGRASDASGVRWLALANAC